MNPETFVTGNPELQLKFDLGQPNLNLKKK